MIQDRGICRTNAWLHINAIRTVCGLVAGAEIKDFATIQNKAKRSIIEFEAGMNMWNHADLDPALSNSGLETLTI